MSADNLPAITGRNMTALEQAADAAREYAAQAKAPNTLRAYASDWRHFCAWCEAHDMVPLPAAPEAVALYLADLASTHKAATLTRRVSAISQAHQLAGQEPPTDSAAVRAVMAGIRRAKGTAARAKAPALTDDVRAMVAAAAPLARRIPAITARTGALAVGDSCPAS